jgi:hypothetical protein
MRDLLDLLEIQQRGRREKTETEIKVSPSGDILSLLDRGEIERRFGKRNNDPCGDPCHEDLTGFNKYMGDLKIE